MRPDASKPPNRGPDGRSGTSRRSDLGLRLPSELVELLEGTGCEQRHPGLQLDKFSPPGEQKNQGSAIEKVCRAAGDEGLLRAVGARRSNILRRLGARTFLAKTTGPLTLHLARASALENAGIHLHPLYGFCCLPASGIKGATRAWAETVWLPEETDRAAAKERLLLVFGRTPTRAGDDGGAAAQAGAVVFHDAWPRTWPRLVRDIVNNHHVGYYEGRDAPGDWEEPNPVNFLAVPAGVEFDFSLSLRDAGATGNEGLLDLVAEWLAGALVHEGLGAKTNAGYGRFELVERSAPAAPVRARRISTHSLELATPAFLAGARQEKDDCTLRPATLRGLLRWWWRTMHAGHLDRADLLALETAIWGSAEVGGAVALSVRDGRVPPPERYDYKTGYRINAAFAQRHGISAEKRQKTVQGLFYASYGMADGGQPRWFAKPGSTWRLALSAREGRLVSDGKRLPTAGGTDGKAVPADRVLRQAQAALWLLCRYGAAGSKARKGFGSFNDLRLDWVEGRRSCIDEAAALRRDLGLGAGGHAESAVLEQALLVEKSTVWTDAWFAMDRVGSMYREVVKSLPSHERETLGLPRRGARKPAKLKTHRHASPLLLSLSGAEGEGFTVRLTAFPAHRLPDHATSRGRLENAVRKASELLENDANRPPAPGRGPRGRQSRPPRGGARSGPGQRRGGAPTGFVQPPPPRPPGLPKPGVRVEVVLLEERTKKGGWRARHEPSGEQGAIQNWQQVPDGMAADERVTVIVAYARPGDIAFKWPTDT